MKNKIIIITSVMGLILATIGITYAFFSARITGIESASTLVVNAGRMGITYAEGNGDLSMTNIYPRENAWITKVFTITGNNTTGLTMNYELSINVISNTFPDDYIKYTLTNSGAAEGTTAIAQTNKTSLNGTGIKHIGYGGFGAVENATHTYTLSLFFYDNGLNQNDGQGKVFNAKISLSGYDGELSSGTYFGWGSEASTLAGADTNNYGIALKKTASTLFTSYNASAKSWSSQGWNSSSSEEEIPYACASGVTAGTEVCVNYKTTNLATQCTNAGGTLSGSKCILGSVSCGVNSNNAYCGNGDTYTYCYMYYSGNANCD